LKGLAGLSALSQELAQLDICVGGGVSGFHGFFEQGKGLVAFSVDELFQGFDERIKGEDAFAGPAGDERRYDGDDDDEERRKDILVNIR